VFISRFINTRRNLCLTSKFKQKKLAAPLIRQRKPAVPQGLRQPPAVLLQIPLAVPPNQNPAAKNPRCHMQYLQVVTKKE
jgi:hypothetical protein